MSMIGGSATKLAEAVPRFTQGVQISCPRRSRFACLLSKPGNGFGKTWKVWINHRVGPEIRHNPRLPARFSNLLVVGERIQRRSEERRVGKEGRSRRAPVPLQ